MSLATDISHFVNSAFSKCPTKAPLQNDLGLDRMTCYEMMELANIYISLKINFQTLLLCLIKLFLAVNQWDIPLTSAAAVLVSAHLANLFCLEMFSDTSSYPKQLCPTGCLASCLASMFVGLVRDVCLPLIFQVLPLLLLPCLITIPLHSHFCLIRHSLRMASLLLFFQQCWKSALRLHLCLKGRVSCKNIS